MPRHNGGKGIQLEIQIRVAGGDHFVIDKLICRLRSRLRICPEMTFKAFFCAMNHIARVVHSLRDRFLVRPIARGVRAKPCGSRTVAIFATHTLGDFKRATTLFRRGVKRVTGKTSRRFFSLRAELQNACHAFANFACENLKSPAMFVFQNPGCVFRLQNAAIGYWLDAAVAACGSTGARSDIFLRFGGRLG